MKATRIKLERKGKENVEKKDLEIYIHIPFCVKKCDYCDFLSAPSSYEGRKAYTEALCQEIIASASQMQETRVRTVFIGGGTPSILETELMEKLLQTFRSAFCIADEAEFTIEANPGTLTAEKLRLYLQYGINRLSLGLQSVFDDDLHMLGRMHSYQDFERSYCLAREIGFQNMNIDLISAIPGQTRERWADNLKKAASLKPEHISAYSLIVEEGTPFYEKELDLPDEDMEYEMYEDTGRILAAYGYAQYEISNYAKPGKECRHNIGYWKREDYLGFGLGASSFINSQRFSNTSIMEEYLENAGQPSLIRREIHPLTEREQMEEFMFLGLRMTEGISERDFAGLFGKELMTIYGSVLLRYEATGHLIHEKERWKFSRKGIHVSNWILADFLEE